MFNPELVFARQPTVLLHEASSVVCLDQAWTRAHQIIFYDTLSSRFLGDFPWVRSITELSIHFVFSAKCSVDLASLMTDFDSRIEHVAERGDLVIMAEDPVLLAQFKEELTSWVEEDGGEDDLWAGIKYMPYVKPI